MPIRVVEEKFDLRDIHEIITDLLPKGYNASALSISIGKAKTFPEKQQVTLQGYIDNFEVKSYGQRLKRISAKLYKDGESITLYWISSNQKYKTVLWALEKSAKKDVLLQVTGKIEHYKPNNETLIVSIAQPKINALESEDSPRIEQKGKGVIIPEPLYVLRNKISPFQIKTAFKKIIDNLEKEQKKACFIPKDLETKLKLKDLKTSLQYIHGFKPIKVENFEKFVTYPDFINRIKLEKIWRVLESSSKEVKEEQPPLILYDDKSPIVEILKRLPFELTQDQKKAIHGLLLAFSKRGGSKSLVFGDVGSGKTLVALIVSYYIYQQGGQVAFITPTGVLSKQHFEEAQELLGIQNLFFIDSKTKIGEKRKINKALENGEPAIVIGTTSVNSLLFSNLKAIFIDEEQKLGVVAKEKLYNEHKANIVYMTATPIPRTLASSIFTNFNVLEIRTKPAKQKPRITKINFDDVNMVAEKLKNGEQGLVIVPAVSSNDMINVKGAMSKYKKLFPFAKIVSIHGKMKKEEVDKIVEEYMQGESDILIATTMVDSGFSNKNLSFVFIESADRFGISQLHQIRGRCGRGDKQGYCYLIPSAKNIKEKTLERLNYIVESEDGFELAKKDVMLRGTGDLTNTIQSGTELNFIDYVEEIEVMREYLKKR